MSDPRYMNVWRQRYDAPTTKKSGPDSGMHGASWTKTLEVYVDERLRAIPSTRLRDLLNAAIAEGDYYRAHLLAAERDRRWERWCTDDGGAE